MKDARDWVVIGEITRPHGIKGAVRVTVHTDYPERFDSLSQVYIMPAGGGLPREVSFALVGRHKQQLICCLEDVSSREAAEKLRGMLLVIPRDEAIKLPPDHYYIFELVGLAVYTEDGKHLGRLKDVLQPGANDVYIVEAEALDHEILLPAIKDVIISVDLAKGQMLVRLLPGLLDL